MSVTPPFSDIDIEVVDLCKTFGDFQAVDHLSFKVRHGEVLGLLGPNGAGKSTLIRMLTTLIPPTSGHVRILGCDLTRSAGRIRQAIGVIPQAMTSDLDLSARENMLIFAKLYGLPRHRRQRAIDRLLAAVDLSQWADKPVKMFSGGMRRRLEIARGLVHEPKIFFLDEPTTGLDPVSRVAVWDMLIRLKQEHDLTIIITTHYMDEADRLCDRIAIVDHGRLVALDAPMKLKASIPGQNVIEVSFADIPAEWPKILANLPEVAEVKAEDHVFRLASCNGPVTMVALLDQARTARVAIASLSVQSTTLDDVFVHYTGRQLRDTLQTPVAGNNRFT